MIASGLGVDILILLPIYFIFWRNETVYVDKNGIEFRNRRKKMTDNDRIPFAQIKDWRVEIRWVEIGDDGACHRFLIITGRDGRVLRDENITDYDIVRKNSLLNAMTFYKEVSVSN